MSQAGDAWAVPVGIISRTIIARRDIRRTMSLYVTDKCGVWLIRRITLAGSYLKK